MNIQDLKSEILAIEEKFNNDKKELIKKYVIANNPYTIGDIITDHTCSIKISSIGIYFSSDLHNCCCIYRGLELKKDGNPRKDNKIGLIYQSNILK